MTDRHSGYIVTLAKDIREDDAEAIVTALRQVRGVLTVEPIVADFAEHNGVMRERKRVMGLLNKFYDDVAARPTP